ncbi:MAG TPA: 50S ribosomal protein L3 [Thermodesulfovibrio thiophilus]|uniref:50S ribosomal protein L3 n=1 Tax=Thermodesulfovibrio thiophilus TaxID=340095 RepID=UPI0018356258|nr:50S ribosomal protein L3 [Thermodesulfovibrio thiophilus]HHW20558.1 50S ribosomal protein L3 [Thermodesulfovibrio thiophilus]HOA83652.1 50S ribosomal protein L3 [Thermodesulfovibrio thiophilus]HQA04345.1 50S ribosomal protein L3 [Thermodesulfovibrio thiophilus]HQD36806.1 50S ribosomal protein L3 [Thermodesulfovibrio thiophilus]
MKGIIGRKVGMTQIFDEEGRLIPVTVIEAGPCWVVQVRSKEKDGYEAVQLGFQEVKKEKNIKKPVIGIFKKAGIPACRFLREFRMTGLNVGDKVTVDVFLKGDVVSITGISKGKGFQGVMKRHRFAGGPDTHGSMFNRAPGSIGASSYPSRVWKGLGMAGHMGNERVTIKNLTIVDVVPEQNLLLVKGAVPGGENGILQIWKV